MKVALGPLGRGVNANRCPGSVLDPLGSAGLTAAPYQQQLRLSTPWSPCGVSMRPLQVVRCASDTSRLAGTAGTASAWGGLLLAAKTDFRSTLLGSGRLSRKGRLHA